MPVKGLMKLEEWGMMTERKLALFEQSKFLGDIKGLDIEALAADMQGFFNMGGFDIRAFKTSGRIFARAYSDYKTGLERILGQFRSNVKEMGISAAKTAAIEDFKTLCADVYSGAYRAGMLRVGNPAEDIGAAGEKIAGAGTKVEAGFFTNRLDAALDPAMDDVIVGGYADSLKSQYFNGMIGGASNTQEFIWKLGSVEIHCPDCLDIAAASPYTKATLPTVPRAGGTVCLWRCDCTLELLGGTAASVGAALRPGEENFFVSVKGLDGSKVSMNTVKLFNDLYGEVNRARVAFEFAVDEVEKKAIIAKKTILAQNIIDLSNSLSIRVIPTWSVGDIKAITLAMKAKGFTFIKDFAQISSGVEVWLLRGTSLKVGRVKAISQTGVTLVIDGQSVTYKSVEDFIGFAKG